MVGWSKLHAVHVQESEVSGLLFESTSESKQSRPKKQANLARETSESIGISFWPWLAKHSAGDLRLLFFFSRHLQNGCRSGALGSQQRAPGCQLLDGDSEA